MNKIMITILCGLLISSAVLAVETDQLAKQMQQAADLSSQIEVPKIAAFNILPIITSNMTPGKVKNQKVNLVNLDKPIFIIGSDDFSLKWLADNAVKLKRTNAVGLLVQADTKADVKRVQQAAKGAIILPMSGEMIGDQLGIHHYPVLITKNLIEQ